jgi:PAT family beta-lactamase induction signal transducer AmpG
MWGSKLIGKAFGTVVMAMVMGMGDAYRPGWGIPAAVVVQFVLLIALMMMPLFMLERPGEKRFPWSVGQAHGTEGVSNVRNPLLLTHDVFRGFFLVTTSVFFVYGLFHVVGWGIAEVITKTLYTQQLGWTFQQFSYVTGVSLLPELVGVLCGGYAVDRWGRRKVICIGFGAYGLLHITFGCLPGLWTQTWFAAGYLILSPGALAIGAVGFLSMGMKISWTKAAATMFTVYMTLSNVGHVIGNWAAGWLRVDFELSYQASFLIAGLVTIAPLVLLSIVNPARVDVKRAEHTQPNENAV